MWREGKDIFETKQKNHAATPEDYASVSDIVHCSYSSYFPFVYSSYFQTSHLLEIVHKQTFQDAKMSAKVVDKKP